MKSKAFYISIAVCFLPVIAGLVLYNTLPEKLPVHWNAEGVIDGYADKPFALFGLPFLMIGLHILVNWGIRKDPKHRNIPNIMYTLLYFFVPVLLLVLYPFTICASLNISIPFDITTALPLLLGILFLLIGNYLPKCKQSYTVGIRTPWALDDEENWNKTHRLGGFLWTIGGLLMMTTMFLPSTYILAMILVIIAILSVIPYIYSYYLYSQKKGNDYYDND